MAFERTNTPPRNADGMIRDINNEFKGIESETIQKAIKSGSLGKYGKTYGELSTQEVCFWIREFKKSEIPKFINLSKLGVK